MGINRFKVIYSRKDTLNGSGLFLVMQIVMIFMAISMWEQLVPFGKIFILSYIPVIAIIMVITRLVFYMQVENQCIKVRTCFGRKYQFSCKDIERVACFTDNDLKRGTSYDITIKINMGKKQKDICISSILKGFPTMAAYLLDMYERGEIKQEAISKNCKKMLTRYKNLEDKK